jgi:hypothetical protein
MNKDGSFTEKDILPVNLALDHRYFDGAVAAKIMKEVQIYIIMLFLIYISLSFCSKILRK